MYQMNRKEQIYSVSLADFEQGVIEASREVTVVVDFWAPWCAPCHALSPVLERVVSESDGKAILAKVNVDENPDLAVRFGIRGIPAVKVFQGGEVVAEFVGALPEFQVRERLSRVIPSRADELVTEGEGLAQAGSVQEARERYQQALQAEPRHPGALLRLGRLAWEDGQLDEAERLLRELPEDRDEHQEASGLLARVEFRRRCREVGGRKGCEKRLQQNGEDLDARYDLACCLADEGCYQEALDEFLKVLGADKHYGDGAAKEAMVRVFAIVGQRSSLADEYRTRLARILY